MAKYKNKINKKKHLYSISIYFPTVLIVKENSLRPGTNWGHNSGEDLSNFSKLSKSISFS